jgi:hypothetical protein
MRRFMNKTSAMFFAKSRLVDFADITPALTA